MRKTLLFSSFETALMKMNQDSAIICVMRRHPFELKDPKVDHVCPIIMPSEEQWVKHLPAGNEKQHGIMDGIVLN